MFISIFGKSFGKIQNANDMLGFLIANADENNNVSSKTIREKSSLDEITLNTFLKKLNNDIYIVQSFDVVTIISLGRNNYISIFDRILGFFIVLLKFVISYTLGIFSGVLVAYFIFKLGIPT